MTEDRSLVLFADRSHQWNRGLRAELRRRGVEVLTTTSASDLADLVTRFGPQVVVAGRELVPDLRALEYRSPGTEFIVLETPPDPDAVLSRIECLLPSHPLRVLCVDDDPLVLQSIARVLRHHGYEVATFEDPFRALGAIESFHPEAAILDIRMPGITGLELAEALRPVPVILLSGMTSGADVAEGYRRGAARFLSKPASPEEVLQALHELTKSQGVSP